MSQSELCFISSTIEYGSILNGGIYPLKDDVMENEDFGLQMPFLDESESFALGFEMGILWQKMEKRETLLDVMIHSKNEKQLS